jgi:hypothetical protein
VNGINKYFNRCELTVSRSGGLGLGAGAAVLDPDSSPEALVRVVM